MPMNILLIFAMHRLQLMERNNVLVTQKKKSDFGTDSLIQDLNLLIRFDKGQQRNAQAIPQTNLKLAMSATAALINYLNVSNLFFVHSSRQTIEDGM